MTIWFLYLLIVLAGAFGIILSVSTLRTSLVSKFIFVWFSKIMPPMSATEREAIAAGDVWHEADLFRGNPNWHKLLANPKPTLTAQESDFLHRQVEELCAMIDDWQISHTALDLPAEVWAYIKREKFFGLHIPKSYGGLGFSALASSTIVQKISTRSLSAAVTVMVPNSLGPAELLLEYGTDEQRNKYLPGLALGEEIPCFGLTSPEAGSDAGALIDSGVITYGTYGKQKNVVGIKLNWNKRYITLAPVATLIGLAVKLYDPEHILGSNEELGITVVLVPTKTPGIEIGKRHFPLNQPFMNGPTRGHDVFVPLDCVIGGEKQIGKGWQMLVECLAAGRGISLPALGTATGKHCYRMVGAYAKIRQQFNLSIGKFEGVASAMAEIGGYTYMLEAMRLLTLGALDQKVRPAVVTAICKYHMTEMARKVINHAMDIHGGRGIILGPRNYLGRIYEGIPISITVEGANILTRCLMIFGQGAVRCHPFVRAEMEAVANPDPNAGLQQFDQAFWAHVRYTITNMCRLFFHSLTFTLFCSAPENMPERKYYRQISFLSIALACCADIAMAVLGGNLKRKENLSARLGDVLSYLYIGSSLLKYSLDHAHPKDDEAHLTWSLQYCLYQTQRALNGFLANFPSRIIGKVMQWIIFPPWRNYPYPKDALGLQISNAMMQDTELRERLTAFCYGGTQPHDPVYRVEAAWYKMLHAEPVFAKIDAAVKQNKINRKNSLLEKTHAALQQKIITQHEANLVAEFLTLQADAVQVDEFTTKELLK